MSSYTSVCCCSNEGGGGGGGGSGTIIMNIAKTQDESYNSGDIFPPVAFGWESMEAYPDPSVMDYNKNTQTLTILQTGQYRLTQTMYHQIETDISPALSKVILYAVDDNQSPAPEIYLFTQGIPSGQDQVSVHTSTKIINVTSVPKTIQWALSVVDPTPSETIKINATTFGGNDKLTNFSIEKINDAPQTPIDIFVGGGV